MSRSHFTLEYKKDKTYVFIIIKIIICFKKIKPIWEQFKFMHCDIFLYIIFLFF